MLVGKFLDLELKDGFRGMVWLNAVDATWPDHELNVDVISAKAWGSHREPEGDRPMLVSARDVLRAEIVAGSEPE